MANGYTVDYKDSQLKAIDKEGTAAIKESDKMYDSMIKQSDSYYNKQVDAVKQYRKTQEENQQKQTDFAIEKIEQQKSQAQKDYMKEQTGAYVDWQKQIDPYGVNAEQMAASGLAHSGYSESAKVSMYNAYQNRVATAREVYNNAVLNYDNAIKDAQLQNSSILAEIAFNTLQTSLELGLQGMQYKNTLLQTKAEAKRNIDNTYYSRYQDRINQINTENSMAEQIRQYNQNYALEQKKYNESVRQYNASLKEQQRQFNENLALQKKNLTNSSSSSSSGSGSGGDYDPPEKEPKDDGGGRRKETYTKMTKQQALNKVNKGQVKNYGAAQTLLRNLGIQGKAKVPMLDSITWQKAKKTGILSSEFDDVKTYGQYVQRYCRYAINECM